MARTLTRTRVLPRRLACAGALLALAACAAGTPPRTAEVPSVHLDAAGGESVDARRLVGSAPLTVLVFFSPECHCLSEHDPRLRELYATYHPRGVQLVMIDSEVHGSPEADAAEARRRGYPFPILVDRGAQLANALGAEYATYSVVVDAQGRVRYHGGIDSDKTHLRDDATPYLRNALDDLLAGRQPRESVGKALGCALAKW